MKNLPLISSHTARFRLAVAEDDAMLAKRRVILSIRNFILIVV